MEGPDIEALATLHTQCLPHSIVGALGIRYVRAFYRYVSRSSRELLIVERNDRGIPVAAAVVTLEPATLIRRLALATPLMACALARSRPLLSIWARSLRADRGAPDVAQHRMAANVPELLLIFTAPTERGKGRATSLIEAVERQLRDLGVRRYEVSTEAEGQNPALHLYARRGFEPVRIAMRLGTRFQVFARSVGDPQTSPVSDATSPPHSM